MKLKYFLRGLGTGILLTALILCINYRTNSSGQDVVEQAKKLGMVFPEGTAKPADEELLPTAAPETAAPTAKADAKPAASGAGVTGEEPGQAAKTQAPEAGNAPTVTPNATAQTPRPTARSTPKPAVRSTPKPTKKPSGTTTTKGGRKFTVRGGLLSSSVAREMKEAGIIQNADAFDEFLEKSGNARKVRAGTYRIPVGASYEEIARIITRQD